MKKPGLFFIVLFLGLSVSFTANAQWGWGKGISGEGSKVTKTLDIDDFTGIGMAVGADVHLTQGKKQKVVIKAQQNIIDNIKKRVRNGNWNIGFEENVRRHAGIDIYITVPTVDRLSIAGSGSIIGKTAFENLGSLEVSISGSGDLELEGSGDNLEVSISGSGKVELGDLRMNDCEVSIAGSGDCEINTSGRLEVSIAGSGDVKYKGNPSKVKSSIAGSGDVRSF